MYLVLCMNLGQFQSSIRRIVDHKTTQNMVVGEHRTQIFKVVVVVFF